MRIVGIESILVDVLLREPVHGVHGVTAVQRSVLVRVATDEEMEGGATWTVRLDAGTIRLDDHPGLGATVDRDALKRYRVVR